MQANCWQFRLPWCGCGGTRRIALPNRAHPGLHLDYMPPLGKCLRRIAPAAAMVDGFVETTLNTNKTQLLPSNYGTFWLLDVCENFIPQNEPSTQLIDATASFKCEMPRLELKSLWSFLAIKCCQGTKSKVFKQARCSLIKVAHICANRGIPVNKQYYSSA